MCAALKLVRLQRGVRATPCTQQSQQQQQQQQQRAECVHTEREPGYIEVLYLSHACMYTFSDRIISTAVFFSLIITYYVESRNPKSISPFQGRGTWVALESLYHVVADVESPSEKSCAN